MTRPAKPPQPQVVLDRLARNLRETRLLKTALRLSAREAKAKAGQEPKQR